MRVTLERVAMGTGLGAAVAPLSLYLAPGIPAYIGVETAERPLLVSLLIGGRLRPDSGRVLVDGTVDVDALRRSTALVDTPVVAEASPGVPLAGVIAEEFSFADLPASRGAVRTFLAEHGLTDYARLPLRALPAADRARVFAELALLRPAIATLVITSPERHGGEPALWYPALAAVAERGISVAIVTDAATADALAALGARDASEPLPEPEVQTTAELEPAESQS